MKRLLFLFCFASVLFASCKKDNSGPTSSVSTDYKAFIIEFTATWCPYCGDNAYPNWDPAFETHPNKVTGISCHPEDGIVDNGYPEVEDLKTFYDCSGYPSAGYNATGSGYPSGTYFNNAINSATAANMQAKAGIGITKNIDGNNMVISTKTILFSNLTGTYNLAIYLTEDKLVHNQSTSASTITGAIHNDVFRGAAGQKAFGTTIISTEGAKGAKFDGEYTITIPSDVVNKDNLHVVAVLFKVDASGNPTAAINSNSL